MKKYVVTYVGREARNRYRFGRLRLNKQKKEEEN